MNVTFENLSDQTALIRVAVAQADYTADVEKALKNYRKTAKVPGFRPGMVPASLINKMYLKSTIAETAYKMSSHAAYDHVKDNKIETLGEIMPSKEQKELDFDNQTEFEFVYQIGLAPEVKLNLTKKDKVEKIVIAPAEDMISGYKENLLRSYGKLVDVDVVKNEEAMTINLDNDEIQIEDAYLSLISIDENARKPYIGKKVGDTMDVDINVMYPDDKQRAAILSVKETELAAINPKFKMTITKIREFQNPELNDEFFAMAFPAKDITNEKELDAKVVLDVQKELDDQTSFKFYDNVREAAVAKAKLSLPDQFLKDWLLAINEGKFTAEQIEEEYPQFQKMMQWDLVKKSVGDEKEIKVEESDLLAEATNMAAAQFKYYGMANPEPQMLENFAQQILSDKQQIGKIAEQVAEKKIMDALVEKITVAEKSMTVEEFSESLKK